MTNLSIKERLARVEGNLEQLVFETRQMHGEIRDQAQAQQRVVEHQEVRVRELERSAEQTKTHLRWMKAAWAGVQGVVVGWVGLK